MIAKTVGITYFWPEAYKATRTNNQRSSAHIDFTGKTEYNILRIPTSHMFKRGEKMKYCSRCGTQLVDEAVVCIGCGCAVGPAPIPSSGVIVAAPKSSGLTTAAKVFMVLGTVIMGIYLIPLAWCIPMTVSYFKKVKSNLPISTGFKVCSLLFVSMLGGIFMLCDKDN